MAANPSMCESRVSDLAGPALLLGIDTCGPSGSVALVRIADEADTGLVIIDQVELEGRSYSATLVAAIGDILARAGVRLNDLGCLVAVNGPGSFTGVRVGLSAAKGLVEPTGIPIVALSRLAVLAAKSGVAAAALDAHRSEVFLRLAKPDEEPRELLAGAEELAALSPLPAIAVCDENAAALLNAAWPTAELVRVAAPTAADALRLAAPQVLAGKFIDPLLLDGHYLRRSDAEIFGERAAEVAARR